MVFTLQLLESCCCPAAVMAYGLTFDQENKTSKTATILHQNGNSQKTVTADQRQS